MCQIIIQYTKKGEKNTVKYVLVQKTVFATHFKVIFDKKLCLKIVI